MPPMAFGNSINRFTGFFCRFSKDVSIDYYLGENYFAGNPTAGLELVLYLSIEFVHKEKSCVALL